MAWTAAAVLLLAATGPPAGWQRATPGGAHLEVGIEPVTLTGGNLAGLEPDGAWVLKSTHPRFGGFSGIVVEGGWLYAVSDWGWWFGAMLVDDGAGFRLGDARLAPMRDTGGGTYTKAGGDAEGLTRLGPRLAVSFERDHRIMFLEDSGRLGGTIQPRAFEQFPSNKGLEGLATLPDRRLIVLAEARDEGRVPVLVVDPAGDVTEVRLAVPGRHSVTGADVGPDGRLYLVLRDYSFLRGASIRIMRYRLDEDSLPEPGSAETLAAFEQADGIDNMEGIAVERAPGGGLRLWLISDDNFSPLQRTLLLRFVVSE